MTGPRTGTLVDFDPYDWAFQDDPYPTYARLRAEGPVHHAERDDLWLVPRHADVQAVMRDDARFSSGMGVSLDASAWTPEAHRVMSFLALDGDAQGRLRRLVSAGFTPRRVRSLEAGLRALAAEHLDRVRVAQEERGEADWIADLAGLLPMEVISRMVGVPVADRDQVRRLADLVVHREDGLRDVPPRGMEAALELITYYTAMVSERRRRPTDDLTSALLVAEVDGDRLRDHEVVAFLFLMVVAGNETTTKLLGNALHHLAAHPAQQAEVFADPDRLVVPWVEETLRHDTSSQMLARHVLEDVVVGGATIPAGARAVVLVGSANRDERVFTDPDRFDVHRDRAELVRTLSFGTGRHVCLGAHLARLEARVVLEELAARASAFEVDAARAVRVHSTSVRGFASLPVRLVVRAGA